MVKHILDVSEDVIFLDVDFGLSKYIHGARGFWCKDNPTTRNEREYRDVKERLEGLESQKLKEYAEILDRASHDLELKGYFDHYLHTVKTRFRADFGLL